MNVNVAELLDLLVVPGESTKESDWSRFFSS
jgi:hypothetical protein